MSDLILIRFLGALAFLLLGVRFTGVGFEGALGSRIRTTFKKLSDRIIPAYASGFLSTVTLQSSGATVALLLSLSSTNPISLPASLAIVLGADLGATLIVQLISFRIASISFLIIAVGAFQYLFMKKARHRALGKGILGFGFILLAILLVTELSRQIGKIPGLPMILSGLNNAPLISFAGGLVLALIFQSSMAVLALLIGFSSQGSIGPGALIPAVLGANLGSTIIAFIASIGGGARSSRIAWGHLLFKLIGVALFVPFMGFLPPILNRVSFDLPHMVANMHTLFNFSISILFLPFTGKVSTLLDRFIPKKEEGDEFRLKYLDKSFRSSPTLGAEQVEREILRMSDVVREMLIKAGEAMKKRDIDMIERISSMDDLVDFLDREIKVFLSDHARYEGEDEGGKMNVVYISAVNHLETIADIVDKGICEQLRNKVVNNLSFSKKGEEEITHYHVKVVEMYDEAVHSFMRMGIDAARRVINRKKDLGALEKDLKNAHIRRLNMGMKESLETSSIHLDLLSNLRRIVSLSAGIAYLIIDFKERF